MKVRILAPAVEGTARIGYPVGVVPVLGSRVRHSLESALPSARSRPMGAAGVGEDEELVGARRHSRVPRDATTRR